MKMFISKYALTCGILECILDGELKTGEDVYVKIKEYGYLQLGKEVHKTRKEAEEAAIKLQEKKIKSLERQLKKLKDLII